VTASNERHAWLLHLEDGQPLAIARQQVVEYLADVESRRVPDCHPQCSRIVLWRGQVLPLLGAGKGKRGKHAHVLVIGYVGAGSDDTTYRIALSLFQPPTDVSVRDSEQCEPAAALADYWRGAIAACFNYQGEAIPIVDFNQFSEA
jgi:hypothetical protein